MENKYGCKYYKEWYFIKYILYILYYIKYINVVNMVVNTLVTHKAWQPYRWRMGSQ